MLQKFADEENAFLPTIGVTRKYTTEEVWPVSLFQLTATSVGFQWTTIDLQFRIGCKVQFQGQNVLDSSNEVAGEGGYETQVNTLTPNTTYSYDLICSESGRTDTDISKSFITPAVGH